MTEIFRSDEEWGMYFDTHMKSQEIENFLLIEPHKHQPFAHRPLEMRVKHTTWTVIVVHNVNIPVVKDMTLCPIICRDIFWHY